jgi:hypothetical protein
MDYLLHPLKGANNIEFGMTNIAVRNIIDSEFEEFRRGNEIFPSDIFQDNSVFCYYDAGGHLEAMEFSGSSRPLLGGINLLSLDFKHLLILLSKLDPALEVDRAGAISRKLSIGIYAPRAVDEEISEAVVEAVLIGRPGYYDFLDSSGA